MKLKWKNALMAVLAIAGLAFSGQASAAVRNVNVMCAKTNTGNYFPVVRISMIAAIDGGDTFEIVLKDGQGEAGIKSITFEKHQESIDFDKYKIPTSSYPYIDMSKKIHLMTNTGQYFTFKSLPTLQPKDDTTFDIIFDGQAVATNVAKLWFYRGNNPEEHIKDGIFTPVVEEEKLQLMSPVSYQLQLSGCGEATKAVVYSVGGKQVAEAGVSYGTTTIQVGHLTTGVYIVKVGNKSLKFVKK